MPFSWKNKTRRNRFSQLVADHLQSPTRGGSLMVETGFPTSIIDLYVRNRGRFRKSSAKKTTSSGSFLGLNNLSSSDSSLDLNNSSSGDSDCIETDEIIEEDVVVADGEVKIENHSVEMAKLNPVFVVLLKVLFMVVLVFGTKRFTIAITLLAFLLFFVELVVKRLISIRPAVDSTALFESRFQETMTIKSSKQVEDEEVELKQEVGLDKESGEGRSEVLMVIRRKSSRRDVMKSRIKKLVPKKLRRSSVDSMDSKNKICCDFNECSDSNGDVKPLVLSNECSDSKGEILHILEQNEDKVVETECDDEELGRGLEQSCGCLILFLVVLVGLIGGRVMALVMALSWCLIMNMLQWRNVKFLIS
ncbi:hypothetical protein L1987_13851 [Smallanthus sonchifolius]|uniref:Uncharacterized protein n=1 Tax=Smallanthus sonchifolius TaxID=185202 RepID=A0ACB9JIK3_9ASTR|nr:hypothetical protein L1987_13851 [Smallanthus sonchifolius]